MSSKIDLDTRQRILSESLRLLEANAGKNVRMSDIAKAAGVSRQAIYLHFKSQTDLMVATVQFGDERNGAATLVQPWRDAEGADKLDAWIAFWGGYVPKIYGVAKALMIARESDEAAAAAWDDRMEDVRRSCRKTVQELANHGLLIEQWTVKTGSDLLWTMLSISNWEQLTTCCSWSNKQYIERMKQTAR
ncbi:MAG: TetR/AcrR family transcriptional regulator, partial [Planctomycetota bacterium]